jgi:hypothetical protein
MEYQGIILRRLADHDPFWKTRQRFNEPFGFNLFSLIPLRKQTFDGASAK